MADLKWKTLRCDNSGPNCPQLATEGDTVYLRSTNNPLDIAVLSTAEFDTLKAKILAGEV